VSDQPIVNTEQAEAWSDEGRHWAVHRDRYDAMSEGFNDRVLAAAAIGEADVVLDVGCGTGQTSRFGASSRSDGHPF
jgi:cyclopropane fatty-acyl-phospholipid synthase-like methyltransferase